MEALAQWFLTGDVGRRLQEHISAAASASSVDHGSAAEPGMRKRRPFVVSGMELFDAVPQAYPILCSDWARFNELLLEAAQRARSRVAGGGSGKLYVRLSSVPGADFAVASVSQLRVADCRRFARVVGTVTRAGAAKVVQEYRTFRCEQCQHKFELRADPYSGYEFEVPKQCSSGAKTKSWNTNAKKARMTKCNSRNFEPVQATEECMNDFQEIRLQDQMKALGPGVVPQSIAVVLFGDLIGKIQPGDTVSLEGVVHQRWKPVWQGKRLEVELFIEATHVERLSNDSPVRALQNGPSGPGGDEFVKLWAMNRGNEWQVRQELVRATAPWLNGMPVPKLALLLTLIGGSPVASASPGDVGFGGAGREQKWNRFLPTEQEGPGTAASGGWAGGAGPAAGNDSSGASKDASHLRTTPHLLLLGDPGTGKSQLLQAAQELSGRSVRTSGLGCTSAGLTCAAVRDGPDFVLEAGALVLADGGICCIDEFSTIRSHDRAAVHEAMEQQTVSVAKAGLVTRLRSQCSVIAAQNCRKGPGVRSGRGSGYNRDCSLAVNSGLPPPLLSRFDLVVVFSDDKQESTTRPDATCLADFILGAAKPKPAGGGSPSKDKSGGNAMVRNYIAWAKENSLPDAPDPRAMSVIAAYFRKVRANASASAGTFTVRFMESLLRLAQAHARLLYHSRVQLEDAVAVIALHRASLQDHVVGADMGVDGEDFPASLPATAHEEMPACGVPIRMGGMQLNHGSDIADDDHYRQLEAKILAHLELQTNADGNLAPLQRGVESSLQLAPIADAPPPEDRPPLQESLVGQLPPPDPKRGRRLGCRFR